MNDDEIILKLGRDIVDKQSFEYDSFINAKKTVKSDKYRVGFDAFSMFIYEHNLPIDKCRLLYEKIEFFLEEKFRSGKNYNEDMKARNEYAALARTYSICPDIFSGYNIEKCVRPDFKLINDSLNSCIGIELYELTDEYESVLNNIADSSFQKGLKADDIHDEARKKHGLKAEEYKYMDFESVAAIGTKLINYSELKRMYADKLFEKYLKYLDYFGKFDQFIILGYCSGMGVSSERDAYDVIDYAKAKSQDITGFKAIILYNDYLENRDAFIEVEI